MIKILYLISSMNIGGAETMVKDYALLLDRSQFDLKIISIDKSYHSANEKALEEAKIPVVHLSELRYPADAEMNFFKKLHRSIARYIDLRKIVKEYQPDVLHAHLYFGNYLRFLPIKKQGIKLLYTVHNEPEFYYDLTGKDKRKYKAYQEICRLIKKKALKLIALHEGMNQELRRVFQTDQVITVNNGINLSRFHSELYNGILKREELGIDQDSFLIGHVGRFHEQKNHELIIDIFYECLKTRKAHLLLVGDGPNRKEMEAKIRDLGFGNQVTILENRKDIPELLNIMDVFLFPSKWEGFGNVLIEAQSMGLPCVISDKVPEEVKVNANVKVISLTASLKEWVDAVLTAKKTTVSEEIKHFDMKNSVLQLENIYRK